MVFRDTTGTQVDVTDLSPLTAYAVAVYTYAGTAAPSINYQQDAPQTASDTTIAAGARAHALDSDVQRHRRDLGHPGRDDRPTRAAARSGTTEPSGTRAPRPPPTIRHSAAGTSPGTIPPAFPFSSVRTLPEASLIYFRGYADNGAGRGYSGDGSFYTEAATQAEQNGPLPPHPHGGDELDVTWNRGSGDGVIVLAREGTAVDADPVDGVEYGDADPIFGNGPEVGTGNYVVYVGAASAGDHRRDLPGHPLPGRGLRVHRLRKPEPAGSTTCKTAPARGMLGAQRLAHAANCFECHFGTGSQHGSFQVPRDADQQTACEASCHNETGPASAKLNFSIHTGPKYTTSVDCGSCHEVHNKLRLHHDGRAQRRRDGGERRVDPADT